MELFNILGNGTPKKFLIFQEMKRFYILENKTPQKIPYVSGGTSKAPKTKISYISPKKL